MLRILILNLYSMVFYYLCLVRHDSGEEDFAVTTCGMYSL